MAIALYAVTRSRYHHTLNKLREKDPPIDTCHIFITIVIKAGIVIMGSTVYEAVSHAKDVALGQLSATGHAREAGEVVDEIPCSHYELIGCDPVAAASTTFDAEESETRRFVFALCTLGDLSGKPAFSNPLECVRFLSTGLQFKLLIGRKI